LTNPLAPEEAQAKAQALLAHETLRMNTLTFLEQIVPPIPPMLYHFHPVTFVGYFGEKRKKINKNMTKEEFVKVVFEAAKIEEKQSGVPAAITTAQAILETYYGKSVSEDIDTHKYSYNLFGIKAHGNPNYVTVWTHEVINGTRIKIKDKFMAYDSFEESIKGRTDFFRETVDIIFFLIAQILTIGLMDYKVLDMLQIANYARTLKQLMTQWKLR